MKDEIVSEFDGVGDFFGRADIFYVWNSIVGPYQLNNLFDPGHEITVSLSHSK